MTLEVLRPPRQHTPRRAPGCPGGRPAVGSSRRRRAGALISALFRGRLGALLREFALLTVLLGVYSAARMLAGRDATAAFRHAHEVVHLERLLHLPSELHLQSAVMAWVPLAHAANTYYAFAHLPVTGLALAWLFLRHPQHYLWARRALVSATAAALAIYLLLPVAPPRMLASLGFLDLGKLLGLSVYGDPQTSTLTDQYAAMPSLHVGWSVLVAVVCISATASRYRWLWVLHPVLTVLVVVSTGNHYWLDGIAGAALVTLTLVVTRLRTPVPSAVSTAVPGRRLATGARAS